MEASVNVLDCPKCGGTIEGSGKCPNCNQLLLVTRDYGILRVTDLDITGIKIEKPRTAGGDWYIHGWGWSEDELTILGQGHAEIGSRIAAKWCKDHEAQILPGMQRPAWRRIDEYIIALALKQNAK